jgi:ferredoxin--NADP+ reductase
MVDIANYCIHYCDCDDVIAVARRGPYEKAYDDREFDDVEDGFDRALYRAELERIRPRLEAAGQSVEQLLEAQAAHPESQPRARTRLGFRFLASPRRVIAENGRVVALEIEENRLDKKGDRVSAVGTGVVDRIPCDTVVFAVGDRVDESAGLPYRDGLYLTAPGADQEPAAAYQVWDPAAQAPMDGVFVVGWARRASDGVVGRARLDAETGIKHVQAFLARRPRRPAEEGDRILGQLVDSLRARGARPVTYPEITRIETVERDRAQAAGVEELKFAANREMLEVIGAEASR